MNSRSVAIVLAAGKGTRMRSATPKVMHEIGGLPMVLHVLNATRETGVGAIALVSGADAPWAENVAVAGDATVFVQSEQRGTAHAVLAAQEAVGPDQEAVVVLYADTPLIRSASIERVLSRVLGGADIAILAFRSDNPTGYGRLLLDANGHVAAIREERDATPDERAVTLCNSGIMAIRAGEPFEALRTIEANNEKGEYYLTDLVAVGRERSFNMVWDEVAPSEVMGVNDRAQLAAAEREFQRRRRADALERATLIDPDTVYFSHDTQLAEDVTVEPHVIFGPAVSVGEGARIRAYSHIEGAVISPGAQVGPFARVRPSSTIAPGAKVGNFVEVKNAVLSSRAKVNHLSYVGDAFVGEGANLGAGTITCNYDGREKHRTVVGNGAFIGSNSALVAPVSVGERAYVGTGSVITEDVPDDALAIARERQVNKHHRSPNARPLPTTDPADADAAMEGPDRDAEPAREAESGTPADEDVKG